MSQKGLRIRRCDECGRYFMIGNEADRYCDRIPDGAEKSCKAMHSAPRVVSAPIARIVDTATANANAIQAAYRKAYKTHYARVKAGTLSEEAFTTWKGMAIKMKGFDGIGDLEDPEDLTDYEADGAFAIQIDLKENYVGDVMDFVDDMLDTYYINTKDLSGKEYYVSKNDGFVRFHVDIAKLAKIIQENDEIMDLVDENYDEDDFKDICKNLSGDVAITVEINGSNIFILAGISLNSKANTLGSFAGAFGANNPAKLPMNTKLIEGLIDDLIEDYSDLLTSGSGYDIDDYDFDDYDFDDYDIDDYDFDDEDI
jgi:hypothetical protein